MASYSGTARKDRAKALVGVALVHIVLGAVILTGLNVHEVRRVVEALKTFDINEAPPPLPQPPPPQPRAERARAEEGAAGKKAEPSPVVAPKPKIEVLAKPPVVAAPVAGAGSANMAGAAASGSGPGAGGAGSGHGGGGTGEGLSSGPRLISGGWTRRDYRLLRADISGSTSGTVRLTISPQGLVVKCWPVRSTGYPEVDARLCPMIQPRMRWDPARDQFGRATTSWLDFTVTLSRL